MQKGKTRTNPRIIHIALDFRQSVVQIAEQPMKASETPLPFSEQSDHSNHSALSAFTS
jgi:hypothetical protein